MKQPFDALSEMDFDLGDIGLGDFDFSLDGFDIGGSSGKLNTRYVKPPVYVGERRTPVLYERAAELARDIGPGLLDGERVDALVSGNFIFGDFLEAFAVETNVKFDDLTLSTLAISKDNVDSLRNLFDGDYLGTLNIVVSDYWYAHNRQNLDYIYEQLDIEDRFQLAVAGVHTKITLLRTGGRKLVMHGSANLRSSRSVENFTAETNDDAYDFHHEWHQTILGHYGTVRKSVRAGALYDLLQGGNA